MDDSSPEGTRIGEIDPTIALRLDDVEAHLTRLATELADLSAAMAMPPHSLSSDMNAGGPSAGNDASEPSAEPLYPSVEEWVEDYFAVVFARSIGGETRWCSQWREHPEATTRLEALWRSWETLRLDPNLGIATWLTNYLDPQLVALTNRAGTFGQCSPDRHSALRTLSAT